MIYNQESGFKVGGELSYRNISFTIGIQTPWQVVIMQKYGHQSAVAIDVTLGTNENKVNCHIETYIPKLKKPPKHDETWL